MSRYDPYREERLALEGEMALTRSLQMAFGLPEREVLIEDFSCAVKRRILLHGRMFISAEHVCFRSDIFGLKTNIVLPMSEITLIRRALMPVTMERAVQAMMGAAQS